MLGIGAAMLGSSHVIGIDVDEGALQTAQENCEQFEDLQVSVLTVIISWTIYNLVQHPMSHITL